MKQKALVQIVAAVVVIVFAVGIWSGGDQVNPGWLRYYSVAVFIATVLLVCWDRFLWKLPLAQRIPDVPRDLSGTWKGTLTPPDGSASAGKATTSKSAYLVLRQTATTTSAILLTDESKSASSLAAIGGGDGLVVLDYLYLNCPDSRVEHRSRMHRGSTSLNVTGRPAKRLRGRYWTDRDTKGELDFTERRKQAADDFDEAASLFEAD